MCGLYSLTTVPEAMRQLFNIKGPLPNFPGREVIYPKQDAVVVRQDPSGARELTIMRWSLLPRWVKDPGDWRASTFNARAETVMQKPSFRQSFADRRCLIPADGFYEFTGERGSKQRHKVTMRDGQPFAFAGLWDRWDRDPSAAIESCTIIVTEPNAVLAPIHDRMPVILHADDYAAWLDVHRVPPAEAHKLLRPYPAEPMTTAPG